MKFVIFLLGVLSSNGAWSADWAVQPSSTIKFYVCGSEAVSGEEKIYKMNIEFSNKKQIIHTETKEICKVSLKAGHVFIPPGPVVVSGDGRCPNGKGTGAIKTIDYEILGSNGENSQLHFFINQTDCQGNREKFRGSFLVPLGKDSDSKNKWSRRVNVIFKSF